MKYRNRKTREIVEVISYSPWVDRSENDWVSYIDSNGVEHHRVQGLNIYWDFEIAPCDTNINGLKWEYLVEKVEFNANTLNSILNGYGNNGWELVGMVDRLGGFKLFIFKKPILDNCGCNCSTYE